MNSPFVRETAISPGLPWTAIIEASIKPNAHSIQSLYVRNLAIILAIAVLALIFFGTHQSPVSSSPGSTGNHDHQFTQ
ncbi:hypothetical protein [Leptothermofonsia sp. ETS-13]|uniref:hypothetical protein n=1 Tax=Leptothermofonsia sp. ETS-13 TaxID=3035696 RepID=UPI003BA26E66